MALPLAMTMRSTTSGGKPVATIQILPRAHVNRLSRAASASTRSTTSVPRRRVFHAPFFAATPCHAATLALNTEPYGSVYDEPTRYFVRRALGRHAAWR